MRNIYHINENWIFVKGMTEAPASLPQNGEQIHLPHTWNATDGQDGGNDYFRGTCCYAKTIRKEELPAGAKYFLEIHGANSSADVFVNGKDCGVVWCAPWEVDVSAALRKGENEIEIRYTNNWYNRLVGDCFLEPENRVTRSTLRYWKASRKDAKDNDRSHRRTRYSGPSADDPLQPSGIIGPVVIK